MPSRQTCIFVLSDLGIIEFLNIFFFLKEFATCIFLIFYLRIDEIKKEKKQWTTRKKCTKNNEKVGI